MEEEEIEKSLKSTKRYNSTRKWSDEEVDLLIDLFEAKSCLWDIFSRDYRNREMKAKAFEEISEELNISFV